MGFNMDYAIVNVQTNIVENIVVLEENSTWIPPEGTTVVPLIGSFGTGDMWNGTEFILTPTAAPIPVQVQSEGFEEL